MKYFYLAFMLFVLVLAGCGNQSPPKPTTTPTPTATDTYIGYLWLTHFVKISLVLLNAQEHLILQKREANEMQQREQMHRQLDPNGLGRQYDLGGFRATYQISKVNNAILLIGLIILTFSYVTLLFTYVPYPASVIVALVSLGLCFLLAIILFRKGWSCTLVYDDGFICGTSRGEIRRVIRWTDIESFVRSTEDSYIAGSHGYDTVYSIILKQGAESFKLDETFGKKFIQAIESAITIHLYPSAQAAYLSGNVVHFGRLDVSQEGLCDAKKAETLPWMEVESISTGTYANTLIRKRGKKLSWTSIDVGEIKNAEVLRRLIAECVVPVHGVKLIP